MDFSAVTLTEAQQAFRDEVRAFLDEQLTPEVYAGMRERDASYDEGFQLAMGAKGWLWPRWQKEDGGAGLDNVCVKILETELSHRDAPMSMVSLTQLVWPAVEAHGDPGVRDELKPGIASGATRICIGYTEPDGGSDIAGAKTRAVRDGDEWVINGQKIFTSNAQYATHVFLITRTDPTLPKHKGLTMFLVPLSTPGFDRQPLPTIVDSRHQHHLLQRHPRPRPVPHRRGQRRLVRAARPAGRRAPPRWNTTASSKKWAPAPGSCGPWRSRSRPQCAGPRTLRTGTGRLAGDEAFLAGIGRLLVEMEGSACTPTAMGKIVGSDTVRLGFERLIDLVGPAATLSVRRGRRDRRRHHRIRPPVCADQRDPRRHGRGVPDHHRPARPGAPAPGLPRPQGVPDRRAPRHGGGVASSGTGPARPRRHWTGPDRQIVIITCGCRLAVGLLGLEVASRAW